ncbi:MAG: hypothetical protein IK006_03640 [Bacteroidaceae bacterium]|nr:hypothetical protein [Bacteroidaceae bacterium]
MRKLPEDQLVEGDLAFRCGRGFFSRAVTATEDEGLFSHVGIVVRENDRWMIVHAVPAEPDFKGDFDRVKKDDPDVFFGHDRACRGCLVHTGVTDTLLVHAICMEAIGYARDSVLFDNDYDLEDASMFYCSEMVWHLYNQIGIDLTEGRRRYINLFHIKGDVILPEHLYMYSDNEPYYSF